MFKKLPKRFKAKKKENAKSRISISNKDIFNIKKKTKKQERKINKKKCINENYEKKYKNKKFESNYENYYVEKKKFEKLFNKINLHHTHFPNTESSDDYYKKLKEFIKNKKIKILLNYLPYDICYLVYLYL